MTRSASARCPDANQSPATHQTVTFFILPTSLCRRADDEWRSGPSPHSAGLASNLNYFGSGVADAVVLAFLAEGRDASTTLQEVDERLVEVVDRPL